jgi:hypothetical protein
MEPSALFSPLSNVELTHLTYALVVVAIFFGFSSLYLMVRLHRLAHSYNNMMRGATGESIERMMTGKIRDIDDLKQKATTLRAEFEKLEMESRKHIQKVGVVRFNAFDNTGSDLSFAVTMMDATDSGFVLSGIYGREESRVYAKPVLRGESSYTLTKEEKQALDLACKK